MIDVIVSRTSVLLFFFFFCQQNEGRNSVTRREIKICKGIIERSDLNNRRDENKHKKEKMQPLFHVQITGNKKINIAKEFYEKC